MPADHASGAATDAEAGTDARGPSRRRANRRGGGQGCPRTTPSGAPTDAEAGTDARGPSRRRANPCGGGHGCPRTPVGARPGPARRLFARSGLLVSRGCPGDETASNLDPGASRLGNTPPPVARSSRTAKERAGEGAGAPSGRGRGVSRWEGARCLPVGRGAGAPSGRGRGVSRWEGNGRRGRRRSQCGVTSLPVRRGDASSETWRRSQWGVTALPVRRGMDGWRRRGMVRLCNLVAALRRSRARRRVSDAR
jgi:hypothetical protein